MPPLLLDRDELRPEAGRGEGRRGEGWGGGGRRWQLQGRWWWYTQPCGPHARRGDLLESRRCGVYPDGRDAKGRTMAGAGAGAGVAGPVSGTVACRLVRDAAAGLECSHAGRVLHNDVAARNCLLSTSDLSAHGCTLKLADFGLSTLRPRHSHAEFITGGDSQYPIGWMAPEALHPPHVFSEASDSYSLGCLVYEMTSGERPWAGLDFSEVRRLVGEGKKMTAPANLKSSPVLHKLFDDCLATDAAKRPTMLEVMRRMEV